MTDRNGQALAYSDYGTCPHAARPPICSPAMRLGEPWANVAKMPDCYDSRGLIECFGDAILGAEAGERELVTFAKWRASAREV